MAKNPSVPKRRRKKIDPAKQRELAAATLVGDVRDALLDQIRNAKDHGAWSQLGEARQREAIDAASAAAEHLVARAVEIVAADGRIAISCICAQFTVKGETAKISLHADLKDDQVIVNLGQARGKRVELVLADGDPYAGERETAKPDPDQREMPLGAGGTAAADAGAAAERRGAAAESGAPPPKPYKPQRPPSAKGRQLAEQDAAREAAEAGGGEPDGQAG